MGEMQIEVQRDREVGADLFGRATSLDIRTDADVEYSGQLLQEVLGCRGKISERFRAPIDAAHRAHKAMLALRNDVDAPFLAAEKLIRDKSKNFLRAKTTESKITGIGLRVRWRFRVIDEKKIPAEFRCLDTAKIENLVKAIGMDAQRVVPGIEVYDDGGVAIMRRHR